MEAEKKDKGVVEVEENVETQGAAAKEEVAGGDDMMITLKSSDEKLFEVSAAAAARQSKLIAGMIKGGTAVGAIPLEKIGSEALGNVVDYCNKHADDSDPSAAAGGITIFDFDTEASKDLEKWDRKLVDRLSHDALFDLIEAADFLNMEGLLEVTCRKVAGMMKGKTAAQIRETFNIKNDYTEDEENQVRQDHAWAL